MTTFITVEGLDGAGKRTLVDGLRRQWESDGVRVATIAFPRYGESIHADLAAEALHGGHGDVTESAYAMALLFALDRREAALRDALRGLDAARDQQSGFLPVDIRLFANHPIAPSCIDWWSQSRHTCVSARQRLSAQVFQYSTNQVVYLSDNLCR